jgi:hypothetical protein
MLESLTLNNFALITFAPSIRYAMRPAPTCDDCGAKWLSLNTVCITVRIARLYSTELTLSEITEIKIGLYVIKDFER